MAASIKRTKKDTQGRVWDYCDSEGCWTHGKHCIGCGGNNGSKWAIWGGPDSGYYEYKTLTEAIAACR